MAGGTGGSGGQRPPEAGGFRGGAGDLIPLIPLNRKELLISKFPTIINDSYHLLLLMVFTY